MLTLLALFIVILAIIFVFGLIAGLATVLMPVLIVIAFLAIDYFVFKLIFSRKKKKD